MTNVPQDVMGGIRDERGFEGVSHTIALQNEGPSAVYLGGESVGSDGVLFAARSELAFDMTRDDVLYIASAAGETSTVRVLVLGV